MTENINLLYIDLFCGAGGTSTGVELARHNDEKCAKVIACINHDSNAIASHASNHPDTLHFTEDIRTLELSSLMDHLENAKRLHPGAFVVLWASLECTNFSKAKGGKPRDADSRTLAEHLYRYIEALNPDFVQIENVEEFMSWGDVDERGKPISRDKGIKYMRWVNRVQSYGYDFEHRILNAADFGAYTSRKRYFGIFAKTGLPVVFPHKTHAKNPDHQEKKGMQDLFGKSKIKKWNPVKDVLDFDDEGESILTRKKPLCDKTLERIYTGLIKFVAGGKENYLLKYNSINGITGKYVPPSVDDPCPVISCQNRLGVVQAKFLSKYYSGHPESKNKGVDEPADAITTKDHHSLISASFIQQRNTGNPESKVFSVEQPARTITATGGNQELVQAKYLVKYNHGNLTVSVDSPATTLTTVDRLGLVQCEFINQQFGTSKPASVDTPLGCITTKLKYGLVSCRPWLMNTNYTNTGSKMDEPCHTITANRKWPYLMNPQFASAGGSVDDPCFTLIARMDKMPPYLITTETGHFAIEIYETDSEPMRKIKDFMALYGIIDIYMRMLKIPELLRIMGFPDGYILIGTQAEQKKYIGNAVEVNMSRVLCEALVERLLQDKKHGYNGRYIQKDERRA